MDPADALIHDIKREAAATARWTGHRQLSPKVLEALRRVRRDRFVPDAERAAAWQDTPLPIGHGQTISQPFIVALMTDLLDVARDHNVLEIGTGSGYQAAVLAELCDHVASVETIPALAESACRVLRAEGYDRIALRTGNGQDGWPERAPFDRIIVTAAARSVPQALIAQLRTGGRMVIPVGDPFGHQELHLLTKHADGRIDDHAVLPVAFVPLIGEEQN